LSPKVFHMYHRRITLLPLLRQATVRQGDETHRERVVENDDSHTEAVSGHECHVLLFSIRTLYLITDHTTP
jgi:hypothetical protein